MHQLRVAQMVRAPDCDSGGQRFKSAHAPHGSLAQTVERQTEDLRSPGSIPGGPTKNGRVAEWSKAADCKSVGLSVYVGSNPTSPTKKKWVPK